MEEYYESLKKVLDSFADAVEKTDIDDIQAIGSLMNSMDDVIVLGKDNDKNDIIQLAEGLKIIAGSLAWGEPDYNMGHLKDGAKFLHELMDKDKEGASTSERVTEILSELGVEVASSSHVDNVADIPEEKEESQVKTSAPETMPDLSQDKELIENFIMEALENFREIEVSIVELEEDPTNVEIINDIFRPFHTIKGVSGFLNLTDINRLTHHVETLLDEARDEKLTIDDNIIDVVLAAIDLTKNMINNLGEQLNNGAFEYVDFGVDDFIKRIKAAGEGKTIEASKEKPAAKPEQKKTSSSLIETKKPPVKQVQQVQAQVTKAQQGPPFIKVDTLKLDNMIDMVGELVINQAMLSQEVGAVMSSENRTLHSSITQLNRITSEIQRISMSMRMIPIKQTFQKMIRLVRDLAKKSGKKIALRMLGEETEIDRNMVDEIYDPLVHIVRNSCDHGLEFPEDRKAKGKDEKGTVTLNAYHKGGNIVIEIKDDGKGLDKEKIIKKAIEKGLIKETDVLTDQETFGLIFQAGFSTADQITDVSGRGVGMDVVKRVIDNMRGKLEVNSEPDVGTTIYMKLPLTLAIIDGIIVRAGERDYIMPTPSVLESLRPEKSYYSNVVNKGEMIKIRESLYPLIRLHDIFGFEPKHYDPWDGIVMVAECDGRFKCILVDEIVGKQEVVIKSLGGLKKVKGMAGGAILADGRVGLILDVAGLFEISEDLSILNN